MKLSLLASALALAVPTLTTALDVGAALHVGYKDFDQFPITTSAATSAGWKSSSSSCDPLMGFAYSVGGNGPTKSHPRVLYFNADGKLSGIAVTVFGSVRSQLVSKGFWLEGPGSGAYTVNLALRESGDQMCTRGAGGSEVIGDRVQINPSAANFTVPLVESDAVSRGWTKGAWIDQMGRHYGFDLSTSPNLSYSFDNFVPVVPMFANGRINAVFIVSTDVQQGLLSDNGWDKVPLPELLFNLNFCGPDKQMWDDFIVSTGHMFFAADPQSVHSPNGCSRCCI